MAIEPLRQIEEALRLLREALPPDLVRALERIDAIKQQLAQMRGTPTYRVDRWPLERELRELQTVVQRLSRFMTAEQRAAASRLTQLLSRYGRAPISALERLAAQASRNAALRYANAVMRGFARAAGAGLRLALRAFAAHPALLAGLLVLILAIGLGLYFFGASNEVKRVALGCDCGSIDQAMLTGPYQRQCVPKNSAVMDLVNKGGLPALEIKVADGKIVDAKALCDSIASGPLAWPTRGGSPTPPPPHPEKPVCLTRKGLVQACPN